MGDLKLHVCRPDKPIVSDFNYLIEVFDLNQSVSGLTHVRGHTLHVVLSFGFDVNDLQICSTCISDHMPIVFHASVRGLIEKSRPLARYSCVINNMMVTNFATQANPLYHNS